jgi:four helix bundle protein
VAYESFKELKVWQEAKSLAITVYTLTKNGLLSKDYGLREQIQRSSVSVVCNIAEGYERNSNKDFIRFLLIAKGSLSELRTQLDIACSVGYITSGEFESTDDHCKKIGAMLTRLIQSRKIRFTNLP